MTPEAASLIERKQRVMIPCMYHFYRDPPVIARGEMQYLFDSRGKRYLDCYAGVSVMNCGHANPDIIEPVIAQIRDLQHTTTIYLTEPIYALAEALIDFIGGDLSRVFFVNSGSEANEGALLLAKLHTGRSRFIAMRGGLHGRTALTMGLTGIDMWRTDPSPPPGLALAPRPHCGDCELGLCFGSCGYACVAAVERQMAEMGDVAAVILEPIQGNGGIVAAPDGYLQRLREVVHAAGALLILDEVQTGFGRTGTRFAYNHEQVDPDILTVAKALGNGFPIAAFCTRDCIAADYTRPGASTTGGNAVSATAALQVLAYLQRNHLVARAHTLGAHLTQGLQQIADAHEAVRELRGRGLMLGMELARGTRALGATTDLVLEQMMQRGFLLGKTGVGRNVLTFMPPLVVTAEDLDEMLTALADVLRDALRQGLDQDV